MERRKTAMNDRINYCRTKAEEFDAQTTALIVQHSLRVNRFSVMQTAAIAAMIMVWVEAVTETAMAYGPFRLFPDCPPRFRG